MNDWKENWGNNCVDFRKKCFSERKKFLVGLDNPEDTQGKIFDDVIRVGKASVFGKDHNFKTLNNIKNFRKQVPIRSYDQLVAWIDREVETKGGILSNSALVRWLKTSGSTGTSKKIPYTEHWMSKFRVPALGVLFANYLQYCESMLSNPYATFDTQTVRENSIDFLNGLPYQGITNRNPLINECDWQPPWYNAPWLSPNISKDYDTKMYYRLRYLVGQDVRAILSINPSTLISLKQHFTKNLSLLIEEIYNGTVCGTKIHNSNPGMAKSLERFQGKESFTFKDVWPNLSLISCWTSASSRLYIPQLEQLFPEVKILPFMTCGTEGVVTLPIDDNLAASPLAINQGFYEFLPASVDIDKVIKEEQSMETLLFNELKLGEEYHLIMSQSNGLCRMAVGDIYKVSDFYLNVPRIEFVRRQGTYHSFTGEKITETQMLEAIESAYKTYGINNSLFMCCPIWDEPPYYKVLIEVENNISFFGLKSKLESQIDSLLSERNVEYMSKRQSGRLGKIRVLFIKKGSIEAYHEKNKTVGNATQFKYKPFQHSNDAFNEILANGIF